MKNRAYPHVKQARSGVAIVITLIMVVTLTIVVVALHSFLKNSIQVSAASVSRTNAQSFTQSVANLVVSDFRNELIASSTNLETLPIAESPGTARSPQNSASLSSAKPYRAINDALKTNPDFSNLVAQSLPSTTLFPTTTALYNNTTVQLSLAAGASAISTATPSLNHRFVSGNRWSSARMILNGSTFPDDQVPSWIYVSRAGVLGTQTFDSNFADSASSNANFVVGRFAYNVYDVSGLLDINAAGYDASSAASDAPLKGALSWADLSALPGMTSAMVSKFVQWRNPAGNSNYLTAVQTWLGPRGFLFPYQGTTTGDRFFMNRQDLLAYQAAHADILAANALPFLTHWTRTIDAPSYVPNLARPLVLQTLANGGNDAYGNDDKINANINQIYDSKGTPVMRSRFPLSRLDLVANNITIPSGPPSTNQDKILKYFGLQWDSANARWTYQHGDNDTGNRILRLTEIPQTDGKWTREPDFFEVLKAAITVGSLGKQGVFQTYYVNGMMPAASNHAKGNRDGQIDYHLMRIGACIIDQYGYDSYPTRVFFNGNVACGMKNLPYLYYPRFYHYITGQWTNKRTLANTAWYKMTYLGNPAPGTKSNLITSMLQPTLWNPHTPPANTPAGPTTFRVVADSNSTGCQMQGGTWTTNATNTGVKADYSDPGMEGPDLSQQFVTYTSNNAYIQFDATKTGASSFREPRTLSTTGYPSGSNTSSSPDAADYDPNTNNIEDVGSVDTSVHATIYSELGDEVSPSINPNPMPSATRDFIGFKVGVYPSNAAGNGNKKYIGPPIRLILQFQGPDGNYYDYDTIEDSIPNNIAYNGQMSYIGGRFDPRTDRWGLLFSYYHGGNPATMQICRSLWPSSHNPPGTASTAYAFNVTLSNASGWTLPGTNTVGTCFGDLQWNDGKAHTASSAFYYASADGVLRLADGGANVGESGLPMTTVSQDAGALGSNPPAATNADYSSRPVILNRPFRSVAEMGYAFRDEAWKSLDFWTPQSGDSALLDYFTLYEPNPPANDPATLSPLNPVVAGCLSPNGPHTEVYQAVIQGTAKASGVNLSSTEAKAIAQALVDWTSSTAAGKGAFQNRAELVGKYTGTGHNIASSNYSGFLSTLTTQLAGSDSAIKARKESILRALVDSSNTRTWNLMIDIIGQVGRFPKTSKTLDQFVVTGEARFWLFVAIDRYTGKITDSSLELVNE